MARRSWGVLALAMVAGPVLAAQQQPEVARAPVLVSAAAQSAAEACISMARERGWALGIVVLDEGGHPVYLFRMEGAAFPRVDFAREKAMTSLLTRRPSGVLLDRVLAGGTNLLTIPGYVAMRGGLPIVVEGRVIGAIGASGATAEEDEQCVARGIEAVFGRSATGLE